MPVILLPVTRESVYSGRRHLGTALAVYAAARVREPAHREIFALSGVVSGHTVKHIAAAAGGAALVVMVRSRKETRTSEARDQAVVYTRG